MERYASHVSLTHRCFCLLRHCYVGCTPQAGATWAGGDVGGGGTPVRAASQCSREIFNFLQLGLIALQLGDLTSISLALEAGGFSCHFWLEISGASEAPSVATHTVQKPRREEVVGAAFPALAKSLLGAVLCLPLFHACHLLEKMDGG